MNQLGFKGLTDIACETHVPSTYFDSVIRQKHKLLKDLCEFSSADISNLSNI